MYLPCIRDVPQVPNMSETLEDGSLHRVQFLSFSILNLSRYVGKGSMSFVEPLQKDVRHCDSGRTVLQDKSFVNHFGVILLRSRPGQSDAYIEYSRVR